MLALLRECKLTLAPLLKKLHGGKLRYFEQLLVLSGEMLRRVKVKEMDCTPKTGSGSLSMMKNPKAQKVKVRPAIHTAFHKLEPINVAFNRAVVPFESQASLNSGVVLTQFAHERTPFGNPAVKSRRKPLIQLIAVPLAQYLQELVHQ